MTNFGGAALDSHSADVAGVTGEKHPTTDRATTLRLQVMIHLEKCSGYTDIPHPEAPTYAPCAPILPKSASLDYSFPTQAYATAVNIPATPHTLAHPAAPAMSVPATDITVLYTVLMTLQPINTAVLFATTSALLLKPCLPNPRLYATVSPNVAVSALNSSANSG